jgi:hypothetical protein
MSNTTQQQSALALFGERIERLQEALERSGRHQLVQSAIEPMRRLCTHLARTSDMDPGPGLKRLGLAVKELRECVLDPARVPDSSVFQDVEAMVPEEPAAGEAETLLASLAGGDDDSLSSLLDSLDMGSENAAEPADGLGTLREPLASSDENGSSARVLMKGELHPGILSDLIQLFAQNRETGKLVIDGGEGNASLYMNDGQVIAAQCNGATGEEGFFNLMLIRTGRFAYQRGVEAPEPNIHRGTQALIMDTLRLIDEAS